MAEPLDPTRPLFLSTHEESSHSRPPSQPIQTPSFLRSAGDPPSTLPVGTHFAGEKRTFPFQGLFRDAAKPLQKIQSISLGDLKLDDLLLLGVAVLLLHEQTEYDLLLVLAYLFVVGL
ncbi:MAG: hypothetical protein ACOX7F_08905 [Eubacteriales bacterium]|jgi:hypothetical protein